VLDEDIRDPGPFVAGRRVSAADVWIAPFLERFAAHLPLLYPQFAPRTAEGSPRFEAIGDWFDAMDEEVPCYSCRVKGRAQTWQAVLAKDPYLQGKLQRSGPAVPDLPTKPSFDARAVWAKYAEGRPHLAPTPAREAAAIIIRNREILVAGAAATCHVEANDADAALRAVCTALTSWEGDAGAPPSLSGDTTAVAAYLDTGPEGLAVPRDLGVIPADALRSLARALKKAS